MARSAFGSSDIEAIRNLHEAWIAAELRGDYDTVLAMCAEDVRWLLPNASIVQGKRAGRRFLDDASVRLEEIRTTDIRVEGGDTLAFKTCRYETRFRAQGGSERYLARGTHLWILRRVRAGWKVALVTWQSEGDTP